MIKVLVVDDEAIIRKSYCEFLAANGFATLEAANGVTALEIFRTTNPSLVLLDLNLPDKHGLDVMTDMRKWNSAVPVIIVTAYGDIPSAVHATREGAHDFLPKPVSFDKLLVTVNRAIEKTILEKQVSELTTILHSSLESVFGKSRPMRDIINNLCRIANTDLSILIQGETGTGKTFIANAIHNLSRRADKSFVKISIGSMPDTLVENELFGHDKGAFTGAEKSKKGYFEAANNGTLFIDDMDNIPLSVQGKLLSVIEDKMISPIGTTVPVSLNIRIICATNLDLFQATNEGRFRKDLYHRISELVVYLPPLRERKDDIAFFAGKFITEACSELDRPECELHEETIKILQNYPWPGNLRQLKNVIRRSVLLSSDRVIRPNEIVFLLGGKEMDIQTMESVCTEDEPILSLREGEKVIIQRALSHTGGQKVKTAALLGITYKTLAKKMQEYKIS